MVEMAIFNILHTLQVSIQRAIINKVCKSELCFLCSAHPIIMLYIFMKNHENISNDFYDTEQTLVYGQ